MKVKNWLKENHLYLFFIFTAFFPSFRILLIGSKAASNIYELFISILPDLLFLISVLFFAFQFPKIKEKKFARLDYLMLAYVLYNVAVGTLIASNLMVSVYAIRLTYLPMLLYFIFSMNLFQTYSLEKFLDKLFRFFVFIAFLGIILYFVFPKVQMYFLKIANEQIQEYFIIRMTSIFWTPVVFGVFISTTILYYTFKNFQKRETINYFFLTILFVCLFLSVSRGAIIVLFLGILILTILSKNWKEFLRIFALEVLTFCVVSFYISNPIEFFYWILKSSGETASMTEGVTRVELWLKSIEIAKQHPFGLGLGKAGHVAERFFSENSESVSRASTDGWFLKLLNETGFIGLIFYLLISLLLFIQSIRYFLRNKFDLVSFLLTILIVVNIQNLVSNVNDFFLFSNLFWILIGILMLKLKSEQKTIA
jgi:hypothetical protein